MIKAVFFDLYNTLARFYPPREELQAVGCAEFGIQVTPEGIDRGYALADAYMAQENAVLPLRNRSPGAREEFFAEYQRLILQGAGAQVPRELAGKIWRRIRQIPYDLALFDDVLPAMDMLKLQGLTLGLISNINRDINQLLEALRLSPYLDFAITSREVGAEKPHPPIFLAALERAQVEPGEAIHVGDQYTSDVQGARGVGINPVLLDRYGTHPEVQDCPRIESLMELSGLLADYIGNPFSEPQ